jgi:Bifunctional DNA primase/polymerase, N-terminal
MSARFRCDAQTKDAAGVQASERPFADAAPHLQGLGLAIIPLGGDDGKEALKRNYPNWKRPPGKRTVLDWVEKHPTANIGVLCWLSGIVIVDIDNAELLEPMVRRFGDTPLIIQTRRGFQLWYGADGGERAANLRFREGLEVEIKAGANAIVVVPPSWNRETGHLYSFKRGGWDCLTRLPYFRDRETVSASVPETSVRSLRPNPIGTRNTSLFNHLRMNFSFASLAEVEAEALWYNRLHQEMPEPPSKVLATARSVWTYMTKPGRISAKRPYIQLTHAELDALRTTGHLYPQTLALIIELKRQHNGRVARGELFAVSAHSMSEERLIPGLTNRKRIEQVRRAAEELGLLIRIREASRVAGQYQAGLYTFGALRPEEPSEGVHRINNKEHEES